MKKASCSLLSTIGVAAIVLFPPSTHADVCGTYTIETVSIVPGARQGGGTEYQLLVIGAVDVKGDRFLFSSWGYGDIYTNDGNSFTTRATFDLAKMAWQTQAPVTFITRGSCTAVDQFVQDGHMRYDIDQLMSIYVRNPRP
jgi:hypothetical protein